jgi:hypothetical protein
MTFGKIGSIQVVNVSFHLDKTDIVDQTVSRFDKKRNLITWKVKGPLSDIDHFIIMKDVLGTRTIVGKVAPQSAYGGDCKFIHNLNVRDSGAYQYVIVPVHMNYTVGKIVKTNYVTIEDV